MASLSILAILFAVAETQSMEQTTKTNGYASNNITCQFHVLNLDHVKQQFFDFVSVDKASLVFFNIEVNQDFLNITSYDNIHNNGILRWLWVADSQLYILSYPIDLDGITLQLTKSAERTVHLAVNATIDYQEHNASSYVICMQSLYLTVFDQILDRNETDWKFCHRYFEGQYWKKVLYFLMGSWLGYDFQCFNAICADIKCADIVKKGTVNIVIDICILLLCLNLPLFYLFLPKRQIISSNKVMHYHKGESPYGFARLFLHLNKNTQTLNVNERQQRKTFSEWMMAYLKNASNLKPEARILSFICLILLGIYVLENVYLRQAIADFDKYTEIYHPYDFSLEDAVHSTTINTVLFLMTFIIILPVLLAYMSYYGQSKDTFLSLNPFGLIGFDQIINQQSKYMEYTGYTQFGMKFLNRISFFFKKELWIHTFSLPGCIRTYPKALLYPICVPYFLVVTPLNLILYTLALLLPMFHFVFDCFLLCPLKVFIVLVRNSNDCGSLMTSLLSSIVFMICCIAYLLFAFRPYFIFIEQFAFRLIVYTIFVAVPCFQLQHYLIIFMFFC